MTSKFIQVYGAHNRKYMLNVDNIASFWESSNEEFPTIIKFTDGNKTHISESYKSFKQRFLEVMEELNGSR